MKTETLKMSAELSEIFIKFAGDFASINRVNASTDKDSFADARIVIFLGKNGDSDTIKWKNSLVLVFNKYILNFSSNYYMISNYTSKSRNDEYIFHVEYKLKR